MNDKKTYEEAVKRLEEIVNKLESGSESLDESMALFEEGARLSAHCYKKLDSAQQRITELAKLSEDVDD